MFAVKGLYGHIQRNSLKSAILLAGFVALLSVFWIAWCVIYSVLFWKPVGLARATTIWPYVSAYLANGFDLALGRCWVPVLFSISWFCIAFSFQAHLIRLSTGARPLSRREVPKLFNMVENLSIAAGLPMPSVEIIETSALNAYAAGLGPDEAVVAVTRGLLDTLEPDELEAVIAHEITHIKNYDVRLMTVASVFSGGLTLVGDLVRAGFRARSDHHLGDAWHLFDLFRIFKPRAEDLDVEDGVPVTAGAKLAGFLAIVVTLAGAILALFLVHLFAIMSQFAISRSREFLADAGAVELTKNPDALISALTKITGQDEIPGLSDSMQAMMISSSTEKMFATHPSTPERVTALMAFAGGRMPVRSTRRPARSSVVAPTAAARFGRRRDWSGVSPSR